MSYKRLQVYLVDLGGTLGIRPCVIVSNNKRNTKTNVYTVAKLTSKLVNYSGPTVVKIKERHQGLKENSLILLDMLYTVEKEQLINYICDLSELEDTINNGLKYSLDLKEGV